MAGPADFADGDVRAVSMLQWKFCSLESDAVCIRAATNDSRKLRRSASRIPDALGGRAGHCRRNARCSIAGRRLASAGDGSWVDGLSAGLVRGMPFVLVRGEARGNESHDRAWNSCFLHALPYESVAGFSRSFFSRGMVCVRYLDRVGSRAAPGQELKCRSCILPKAKRIASDDSIPAYRPTDNPDIWIDGRHRAARCGVCVASGF